MRRRPAAQLHHLDVYAALLLPRFGRLRGGQSIQFTASWARRAALRCSAPQARWRRCTTSTRRSTCTARRCWATRVSLGHPGAGKCCNDQCCNDQCCNDRGRGLLALPCLAWPWHTRLNVRVPPPPNSAAAGAGLVLLRLPLHLPHRHQLRHLAGRQCAGSAVALGRQGMGRLEGCETGRRRLAAACSCPPPLWPCLPTGS